MGQQFIIENLAGGGASIGTVQAAHALPDGYTILSTAPAFVIFPAMHNKVPYQPLKDFRPVTEVSTTSMVLLVNPSLKATTVKELVALID